jgi:uroporphyrinogen decarboxylase
MTRQPDFNQLLKVLRREQPDRPTLFEFFLNARLYGRLIGQEWGPAPDVGTDFRRLVRAFRRAGYDYATVHGSRLGFPAGDKHRAKTISLNEGFVITDRASFAAYAWPDVDRVDYSGLDAAAEELVPGQQLVVCGPGGVLENMISLVGYDNLCFMLVDDPGLVEEIFAAIGSRLVRHYQRVAPHPAVGACISNDDWGFKTQTMLSTADMRKYVFPWHRRIVQAIHAAGKPAILHSCGNLAPVMDDIIDDLQYDGKHSYEDVICPVEQMHAKYGHRIAILGGIDVDFICRSSCAEITARTQAMLDQTGGRAWGIGTGNSVPEYIPDDKYFAMTRVAGIVAP